ncbi:hypothetical protein B0T20DRAFT_347873 [Sordaria brevicollis]|uniref:Autophagy-related protein 101 n=1 Tax=Sordaria brevicollis TaxID=83679 RepID=A0AAE0PJJ1_SORBR|nr:hypothetical protein B0T20DRAFT_347873 [Sordaria brevicollis]
MEKVAPEFTLEAFADPSSVRDVVRGILHTIFFLRYFVSHEPKTRDVCGLELAYIPDAEIETLIDQRVTTLVRQLEMDRSASQQQHYGGGPGYSGGGGGGGGGGRGQITVQFFEKKRRKTWYGMGRGDDEVCWENWTVKVTVAEPRTESVRRAMEHTLQSTVFKCITIANTHKDHIPPITTNDSNPFTYQIHVNPQQHGGLHSTSHQQQSFPGGPSSSKEGAARSDYGSSGGSSGGGGGGSGSGGNGRGAAGRGAGGLAGAAGGAAAAVVGSWATRMGIY